MTVHTYNPSTQEAEAGGLQIQGPPLLQSETLSQKKKKSVIVNTKHYKKAKPFDIDMIISRMKKKK
jgi:hypothetical protein